jgi:outer membrane protein OmpA-like peptidoglycan-associated protein
MTRPSILHVVLIGGLGLTAFGCATKAYVREQVGPATERLTQVSQRVEAQEARLGQTATEAVASRQAMEEARQRLQGLDGRLGEVAATAVEAAAGAREARRLAEEAGAGVREADLRLSQRLAGRNRYTPVDERAVYFDFDRADLKDEAITALLEVARTLQADPNAIVELVGYTDPMGGDRYNLRLSRERVDAVARYLVQTQGIEPRRIHAVGLGKAAQPAGQASKGAIRRSRRVDVRVLAPPA